MTKHIAFAAALVTSLPPAQVRAPTCPHCDRLLTRSVSGRLICVVCWTDEPLGTPELFAEWREGGELDEERW